MQQRKLEDWLTLGLLAAAFCMLFVLTLMVALDAFARLADGR